MCFLEDWMKKIFAMCVMSAFLFTACGGDDSSSASPDELSFTLDSFTDERDDQTYKTVQIGDQIWMAENLNYKSEYSSCYNDSLKNCSKYGRLYGGYEAKEVCPEGWRLPSRNDVKNCSLKLVEIL